MCVSFHPEIPCHGLLVFCLLGKSLLHLRGQGSFELAPLFVSILPQTLDLGLKLPALLRLCDPELVAKLLQFQIVSSLPLSQLLLLLCS